MDVHRITFLDGLPSGLADSLTQSRIRRQTIEHLEPLIVIAHEDTSDRPNLGFAVLANADILRALLRKEGI